MHRRKFIKNIVRPFFLASFIFSLVPRSVLAKKQIEDIFPNKHNGKKHMLKMTPLPYGMQDLEPHLSAETLDYHYNKHHTTYLDNLNKLLENSPLAQSSLEEIIIKTHKDENKSVFNNAAQVLNHDFYWKSMKKSGGGAPSGKMLSLINENFGSYDAFSTEFKNAGLTQFGSGWAWLTQDVASKKLKIVKTPNAENPITQNLNPLMTMDVWEHAYYIDYRNKRAAYADMFLQHLLNWEFAESNLK